MSRLCKIFKTKKDLGEKRVGNARYVNQTRAAEVVLHTTQCEMPNSRKKNRRGDYVPYCQVRVIRHTDASNTVS